VSIEIPQRYQGIQYRTAEVDPKNVDPDEGTLLCRVAPYDHEVPIDHELFESFAPKAFERAALAPTRVKMWMGHGGPLIGHARVVEDKPDGVWVRAKFANTLAAQEARALASDAEDDGGATLDQVSVTFKPMRDWMKVTRKADGVHVRHARAGLLGFALVAHGAYAERAMIASVRDGLTDRDREARIARLMALDH
jgi:phage head maturation protease